MCAFVCVQACGRVRYATACISCLVLAVATELGTQSYVTGTQRHPYSRLQVHPDNSNALRGVFRSQKDGSRSPLLVFFLVRLGQLRAVEGHCLFVASWGYPIRARCGTHTSLCSCYLRWIRLVALQQTMSTAVFTAQWSGTSARLQPSGTAVPSVACKGSEPLSTPYYHIVRVFPMECCAYW